MKHQVVGYVRVSSQGQNTARQLVGIQVDKEFIDIKTGNVKERANLIACIDYVREGDTLVVDSIDRLARNLRHLQEIITQLLDKGVTVRFIKENLTFTKNQDPMAMLMLHMMGAFAEFERNMIRSRQKEGIDLARKAGKHLGRKSLLTSELRAKAQGLKSQGYSIRKIAMILELSRPTIYKALDLYPKKSMELK